jgi:hypothetical protein
MDENQKKVKSGMSSISDTGTLDAHVVAAGRIH